MLSHLKSHDLKTLSSSLKIIGQFIAIAEGDDLCMRYINEYNVIDDIKWVLLEGSNFMRMDAVWII